MGITLEIYRSGAKKKTSSFGIESYSYSESICDIDSRTAWFLVNYLHHIQKIDISKCMIDTEIDVGVLLDFAKRVDSISMFDSESEIEDKIGVPRGWYDRYSPQELSEDIMYAKYDIIRKFNPVLSEKSVIIDAGW